MAPPDLPLPLRLTIRPGTVYYFQHRGLTSGEPHYFAIINADPPKSRVIIMTVGSSQVDTLRARRKNMPPETLVQVEPSQYPDFTKSTIIDCNQVFELSVEELVQKFNAKELRYHRDLPREVLEKIWRGVRASPRVDESHKNLIPPEASGNKSFP